MNLFVGILFIIVSVNAMPKNYYENICGYGACPKTDPNSLNVHIVPHSHDDVGWLKTVDQYYYGTRSNIQHAGVQFILDSVIQALHRNPDRRFIQVETAFFWKWWQEQGKEIREQVRHLVNNGQLEIIGGAWSMNDEAAVHYHSTVDQFTWGFRKLDESLGECAKPKIGWQIDPFGHSREQASLFAEMGFDGLFFARLDYRDKEQRLKTKTAEMLWQGSQSLGSSSQIFTHVLYNHYMTPPGFCFDVMCSDTPIVDNEKSPEYNADKKAQTFLKYVKEQQTNYKTNNVIITMGGDFHYQDALSYFINMDRLMKAMRKEDPNTNVFYSTPSCYLKAVNDAKVTFSIKTDDFFPYASDPHSYWTGYFTSRPTSKRMERLGNNLLQVTKQLSAAAFFDSFSLTSNLTPLREAMGVMQHHDAITGTEKQHVADDYHRILHEAIESSADLASASLNKLIGDDSVEFKSCLMLNISQCEATEENKKFLVTVYNPLSRPVQHYVRLPVPNMNYKVSDATGEEIEIQFVPIFEMIANMPGRKSKATYELVFRADALPPLGQKIYYVEYINEYRPRPQRLFKNEHNIKLKLKSNKDHLKSYLFKDDNVEISPEFLYYNSKVGNNMVANNRSSGAYIFRPREQEAFPIQNTAVPELHSGPHVAEYFEQFLDWVGRITRIYEKENHIESSWIVGPIPTSGKYGKEIITRYSTGLETNGVFYTDSNGREMMKRIRDYRSNYNLTDEEPVSRNYYPVTSKISIVDEDNNVQVSVLNDRAQGGSSLKDGDVELMVHRRLLVDDAFGVGEALNEKAFGSGLVAIGKHYITVGPKYNSNGYSASGQERLLAPQIHLAPWLFITPLADSFDYNYVDFTHLEKSALNNELSNNVQILTLEPWGDNVILLRLEHILEKNEDPILSQPAIIDLNNIFSLFEIKEIREMNLGANQLALEVERLQWLAENDDYYSNNYADLINKRIKNDFNTKTVTINPMEIKTFLILVY